MTQTEAPGQKPTRSNRWAKGKIVIVVVILVLASLSAALFWMAWDYRGAKNRAEHTLVVEMTNSLTTAVMRISSLLDDGNTVETRVSEAWWANMMLDRLHWDALAVGALYSDDSSAKEAFYELAYAFDELKLAVLSASSEVGTSGDIEESLNSGLETSAEDLQLVYQELWDAMDKSTSWSDYPPSTVKYIDLGYVEGLAAEIRASV